MSRAFPPHALAVAACALALAACPSDPRFVLEDVAAPTDAADAVTSSDVPSDANGCGPTCGPAMVCQDGRCQCPPGGCDETLLTGDADLVAVAIGSGPAPFIAFDRDDPDLDLGALRWSTCCGWAPDFAIRERSDVLSIGVDDTGHAQLLGLGAEGLAMIYRYEDGSWKTHATHVAPCHFGALVASPGDGRLVLGCTRDRGEFELYDADPFSTDYMYRVTDPLGTGSPLVGPVRFALDSEGQALVAFTGASTGDERQVLAAREAGETWQSEPIDLAAPGADGLVRLAPAVASDGIPHVLVVHPDAAGDRLVDVADRGGAFWTSTDLATGVGLGRAALEVARASDGTLQVVYDVGTELHWWSYTTALDATASHGRRVDASGFRSAALTVREGHAFVTYVTGDGKLHLWRPTEESTL